MVERNLYIPPEVAPTGPLIFLAGPIQGTGDWQSKAVEIIHGQNPEITIANPRRPRFDINDPREYDNQVDWETLHLKQAVNENGVIMFWLARETEHDHKRAYAQTTRAELFEKKMEHQYNGARLVIGIQRIWSPEKKAWTDAFSGSKYIRRRFEQDCPDVPILDTLKEACIVAVKTLTR